MIHPFPELIIGGVLIAPFVAYAGAALVVVGLLRPLLMLVGFEGVLRNPALGLLCIYVAALAAVMLWF